MALKTEVKKQVKEFVEEVLKNPESEAVVVLSLNKDKVFSMQANCDLIGLTFMSKNLEVFIGSLMVPGEMRDENATIN